MRLLTAILALLASVASIVHYVNDVNKRDVVESFIRDFTLEQRRPVTAEDARLTQAWDNSYWVVADAALQDVLGSVNFNLFTDAERRMWIENVTKLDEELERAIPLAREAIAARPGWPYHQALLGQLTYAKSRRGEKGGEEKAWLVPLQISAADAPGSDAMHTFLAGSLLEQYHALDATTRAAVPKRLQRASLDAAFVRRAFAPASALLGRDVALAAIPNEPLPIASALQILEQMNDVEAAAKLLPRWERLELAERAKDTAEIERLAADGDGRELRAAVLGFFDSHRVNDFDRPDTALQWLKALAYYPPDVGGQWQFDRRGEVLRYFLAGRVPSTEPGAFVRVEDRLEAAGLLIAAQSLEGVPETVLARCMLAAGDVYAAESLSRRSDTSGSFEWTPFLLELSRHYSSIGRDDRALERLAQIAPGAQQECDVRLARQALTARVPDLARRAPDAPQMVTQPGTFTPEMWPPARRLSLCIDPSVKQLTLSLTAAEPSLVDVGWSPARTTTVAMTSSESSTFNAQFSIPLPSPGRHTLFLRKRAGAQPAPTLTIR